MDARRQPITVLVLAAVVVVVLAAVAEAQLCALCECPATNALVCGRTIGADGRVKFRGFSSRCVMECNNKCRKTKYEFVKRGRCGPKVPKPTRNPSENSVLPKRRGANNATMPGAKVAPAAE
ncbi:uncharacterized protein LOC124155388 isoform X2 [Ischnura elegans]|uniref:uncharacterized protein LOC124155388 isoform X2 n=1 Tax=Ischnura elegans TaxID=197161 RepID=UPI001ED88179|nr:uncharacterized protein LOC124155388 isoform X2 [Ischnura elegans]